MDNLEEMEKFLGMYNLLRLSQKKIENMIRQITSKGIKPVILKCPRNKSTGLHSFPGEFYQTFIGKLTPILLKMLPKHHRGRNTSKLILEGFISP